jgi:hypothetical protein
LPASPKVSTRSGRKSALLRALALCFLPFAFCLCAQAQYSLDGQTIDGGGGTSTGGVYSVSGTLGQPDAIAMSGGHADGVALAALQGMNDIAQEQDAEIQALKARLERLERITSAKCGGTK